MTQFLRRPVLGLVFCLALTAASAQAATTTIAQWTFETSLPATAGSFAAEVGSGLASGNHASASAVYSSPVGNGSAHSFSSNNWGVGDYYQFQVSTAGKNSIALSWDQISSGTGPKSFNLAYSTNGTSFTTFAAAYTVLVNTTPNVWSSATSISASSYAFDLSGIAAINNQSSVYFRLVDASTVSASGGVVGTGGTDRVDNFTVTAAVPEPESYAMMLAGLGLMGCVARRRSK